MKKLLLLEPDRLLGRTYAEALTHSGFVVTIVRTAEEAIRAVDQELPQVVVLELQLIGHNGIAFLQEFRSYSEWRHVPVIINTQLNLTVLDPLQTTLTHDFGVCAWLYKPQTSLQKLIATVKEQGKEL